MRVLAALLIILILAGCLFLYYFMPEDLVAEPETYTLRSVTYKGEKITDVETLKAMAEVIEEYQNMPRPKDMPTDIDEFVDLKILGPVSESKPTLVFGQDIYGCYWSKKAGIYEIIDGEILYDELIEILEK